MKVCYSGTCQALMYALFEQTRSWNPLLCLIGIHVYTSFLALRSLSPNNQRLCFMSHTSQLVTMTDSSY